jgi:hypothetical protein
MGCSGERRPTNHSVIAGLDPAIHAIVGRLAPDLFATSGGAKGQVGFLAKEMAWMAGSSPAMTTGEAE